MTHLDEMTGAQLAQEIAMLLATKRLAKTDRP